MISAVLEVVCILRPKILAGRVRYVLYSWLHEDRCTQARPSGTIITSFHQWPQLCKLGFILVQVYYHPILLCQFTFLMLHSTSSAQKCLLPCLFQNLFYRPCVSAQLCKQSMKTSHMKYVFLICLTQGSIKQSQRSYYNILQYSLRTVITRQAVQKYVHIKNSPEVTLAQSYTMFICTKTKHIFNSPTSATQTQLHIITIPANVLHFVLLTAWFGNVYSEMICCNMIWLSLRFTCKYQCLIKKSKNLKLCWAAAPHRQKDNTIHFYPPLIHKTNLKHRKKLGNKYFKGP